MTGPLLQARRFRPVYLLVALAFVLLVTVGAGPASAASPCDALPSPLAGACSVTPVNGIGTVASNAASAADCVTAPVDCVARSFGEAASWFMQKLATVITATTEVDMTNDGFLRLYGTMFGLAAVLTLVRVLLSIISNVARGQGMEAVKAATGLYIAAVAVGAFAPAVVYVLLQLSDGLTRAVTLGTTDDTARFLTTVGKTMTALPTTISGAVVLLVALLMVISALVLWLELLLRAAAIYTVTLFAAPVASGLINRNTWGSVRRWVHFLMGIILAKPAIAAVLALSVALASNGSTKDDFSSVLTAIALLLMAVFATALLFKFIPHVGDELAHVASARRELANSGPAAAIPGPAAIANRSITAHTASRPNARVAAKPTAAGGAALTAQRVTQGAVSTASRAAAGAKPPPTRSQPTGADVPRAPAATPPRTRGRDS